MRTASASACAELCKDGEADELLLLKALVSELRTRVVVVRGRLAICAIRDARSQLRRESHKSQILTPGTYPRRESHKSQGLTPGTKWHGWCQSPWVRRWAERRRSTDDQCFWQSPDPHLS